MLIVHADDYAVSMNASRDIADLICKNKLDSTSVIPNMSCYEESVILLKEALTRCKRRVRLAVHINLMEGHCVADAKAVSLLIDQDGYFRLSWGDLFLASYKKKNRNKLIEQLKTEIFAQVKKVQMSFPGIESFRIDSHQHTHVIPIVWDALAAVLRENDFPVSCIRIPEEPLSPYYREKRLLFSYGITSWVKNILLHFLSERAKKVSPEFYQEQMKFWGLLMTGHMDTERVRCLYPHFEEFSLQREIDIEMVFHPGQSLPDEIGREYTKKGFVEDHLSPNRKIEYETIWNLDE